MGWKINVHDHCENEAASETVVSFAKSPTVSSGSPVNFDVSETSNHQFFSNHTLSRLESNLPHAQIKEEKYIKSESGRPASKNQFGTYDARGNHKVKQGFKSSLSADLSGIIPQNFHFKVDTLPLQGTSIVKPLIPVVNHNKVTEQEYRLNQVPDLSLYSITEEIGQPVFQNFHILPKSTSFQDSKPEVLSKNHFHNQHVIEEVVHENPTFPTMHESEKSNNNNIYINNQAEYLKSNKSPFSTGMLNTSYQDQLSPDPTFLSSDFKFQHGSISAQNKGFDPKSVKVEVGFKPILHTTQTSKSLPARTVDKRFHNNFYENRRNFESSEKRLLIKKPKMTTNNDLSLERRQDEIPMANERKDFYMPPLANSDVFRTYDGRSVKTERAPNFPEFTSSIDVHKLPQFVPFRGAIPPLSETVNAKNLPQLMGSKLARVDILPPSEIIVGKKNK